MDLSHVYFAVLILSTAANSFVAYYSWKKRHKIGWIVPVVLFFVLYWSFGQILYLVLPGVEIKRLIYVYWLPPAVHFAAILWAFFLFEYTGKETIVTKRNIALTLIIPAITLLFAWTNEYHQLYWIELNIPSGAIQLPEERHVTGPAFSFTLAYAGVPTAIALGFLTKRLFNPQEIYRRQVATLIASTVVIWGAGLSYFVTPSGVNLTPVGFTVSGVLISISILREGLLDVLPVARDSLVVKIEVGVLVVDNEGKVVDINSMTKKMFRLDDDIIGKKVTDVLTDYPRIREIYDEITPLDSDSEHVFSVSDDEGETRHYKTQISPLYDQRNNMVGHTFVINDITNQKRREAELEQRKEELERQKRKLEHQNERLDDFASIVSHDLRNPLNVAEGYVDALRHELNGNEEIEIVQESIDRMNNIIDDSLTLARQGKAITETKEVNILEIVREAWDNVDTAEAELVCETDELVTEADEGRLLNLFENLFRNAVEHGGEGVTVRVGATDGGFYVEDDGPGIPEEKRGSVFEHGYTTNEQGTGLGLSIVKRIVEAHDWEITAGEADDGGARFEIRTRTHGSNGVSG